MHCRNLKPGDLFRISGHKEVYMWLHQPIEADDSEINYHEEDPPQGHPALQDGTFYAVRNDGLPAPEFILDEGSLERWASYDIEKVEWPWEKLG